MIVSDCRYLRIPILKLDYIFKYKRYPDLKNELRTPTLTTIRRYYEVCNLGSRNQFGITIIDMVAFPDKLILKSGTFIFNKYKL